MGLSKAQAKEWPEVEGRAVLVVHLLLWGGVESEGRLSVGPLCIEPHWQGSGEALLEGLEEELESSSMQQGVRLGG